VVRTTVFPPALLLVGSVISIQGGAALATVALPGTGPSGLAVVRLGFAAVVLGVLLRPRIAELRRAGLWRVVLLGVVVAADNWLFYAALQRLAMGPTVTLAFLGPLVLAAVTARRRRSVACALGSTAGIVLLTSGLGPRPLVGALLAVASGAAIAGYVLLARSVAGRSSSGGPVAAALGAGALAVSPLLAVDGAGGFGGSALLLGLAIAVLGSALPYWLEFRAARLLPADTFALLLCLEPAVAAALGWAVLHQSLGPAQLLGVALVVVSGAAMVTQTNRRAHPSGGTVSRERVADRPAAHRR
jgi:inner membrane transporter RhtA